MESVSTITTFIGWCTVLNLGLYLLTALALTVLRGPVQTIHVRFSGLSSEKLNEAYFSYLANYKLALTVLNIVPYLALKLMA
ncbi:MAG: DUF6868 family protein [Halioglobus sp.]